jgi:hypothetical protein
MKKHFNLFILTLALSTITSYAQNVQNYQGSDTYKTSIFYVPGTVKYSYISDGNGGVIRHGEYSFVGKNQIDDDNKKVTANFNLKTNYKQGKFNGSMSVSSSITGRIWGYYKWIPFSYNLKFTGSFKDGKPNGTFNAELMNATGDQTGKDHITATMKEGNFIGAYDYEGMGAGGSYLKMKGQLSDKGKLTGTWKVSEANMTFENDVLIHESSSIAVTPSDVQNVAKLLAEGKLSEDQVRNQGYIVHKKSLPLNSFIYYFFLDKEDYFGFDQIKGWNFSGYGEKEYIEISKMDLISQEGFNKILTAMREGNVSDKFVYTEDGRSNNYLNITCYLRPCYNAQDNYYFLSCHTDFHEKYGTFKHENLGRVILTPKQMEIFKSVQDSIVITSPITFSTPNFETFSVDPKKAEALLLDSEELQDQERANIKNICNYLHRYIPREVLLTYIIPEHKSDYYETANMDRRTGDTCYYTVDSLYLIYKNNYTGVGAFAVSYLNQFKAYQQLFEDCQHKSENLIAEANTLSEELKNQSSKSEYTINENFLSDLQKSFVATLSSVQMSKNEEVIEKVKSIRTQYIQIEEINTQIESNLYKPLLSNYKELLNQLLAKPKFKNIDELEIYESNMPQIINMQHLYMDISEQMTDASTANTELIEMAGKQYADALKSYVPIYKTNIAIPNVNKTEDLTNFRSQLDALKAEQQLRKNYIELRKEADLLNTELTELCASTKNCKKLYSALFKELPMRWDDGVDNITVMTSSIQMLTTLKEKLSKQDLATFDKDLKKVKEVKDFKQILGL